MFYVYILESKIDQSFYIGYTSDLERRVIEHNLGKNTYTSKKKPWFLIYSEEYKSKTEAIKRERYLKRLRSKKYIENLIHSKGP